LFYPDGNHPKYGEAEMRPELCGKWLVCDYTTSCYVSLTRGAGPRKPVA
jgi:hypothetical protein